jgi:hypothetical protein
VYTVFICIAVETYISVKMFIYVTFKMIFLAFRAPVDSQRNYHIHGIIEQWMT